MIRNGTIALLALGVAAASAAGDVVFDQIGSDPGDVITTPTASQFFTSTPPDPHPSDIGALDNFAVSGAGQLTQFQAVANGQSGMDTFDAVTSWTLQIYSSESAAGTSLYGDVASVNNLGATVGAYGDFYMVTLDLVGANINLADGEYWIAAIPYLSVPGEQIWMGTTFINDGPSGTGHYQAAPNGGWPFTLELRDHNLAYRISAVPAPGALGLLAMAGLFGTRRRR